MTELLPCPFCGSKASLIANDTFQNERGEWMTRYLVVCEGREKCPINYLAMSWFDTEKKAIAAWNTRTEMTCHNATHYAGEFKCSECGAILDTEDEEWEPTLWVDGVASYPSFCPNCGCRILEVDDD